MQEPNAAERIALVFDNTPIEFDLDSYRQHADSESANTALRYAYVDGSGCKQHECVVLVGPLTHDQAVRITAHLDEGMYFVPGQLGLADLQGRMITPWTEGIDHPWHVLSEVSLTLDPPTLNEPIASFATRFCSIEWSDDYKPTGAEPVKATAPANSVKASIHSDDHVTSADFDATEWFAQAGAQDIVDLIACEWGGDIIADEIARYASTKDADVAKVFSYLALGPKMPGGDSVGFECHVDPDSAIAWIRTNRPDIAVLVDPSLDSPARLLQDLLKWAQTMGSFDSPVWHRARQLAEKLAAPALVHREPHVPALPPEPTALDIVIDAARGYISLCDLEDGEAEKIEAAIDTMEARSK